MAGRPIEYIAEPLRTLAVPIADLNPDAANARTHDQRNIDAIARSLSRWGQRQPIVVQKQGMVVRAGNGRLAAAKSLGWSHIAAIIVDEDSTEATAYAIADNRTAELAGWDDETLASLLQSLDAEDRIDAGFDDDELQALIDELTPPVEVDEDEAPEPPVDPVTRPGDLWTLGRHRVLCGDCTDGWAATFEKELVFTDPPYGIGYQAMRGGEKIANDACATAAANVLLPALSAASDAAVAFVCCDWRSLPWVVAAMEESGHLPKACIVWDKMRGVQNLDRYHKQHEFVVYAGPYGGQKTVDGDVWQIARDFEPDHPTPKPVELVVRAIETSGTVGVVFDPFLGSGTTLIAAEQLGRTCYGTEISPAYVDVIVRRWQNLTGETATRVDADGNEQPGLPDEGGHE